jgi:hypothetical protein
MGTEYYLIGNEDTKESLSVYEMSSRFTVYAQATDLDHTEPVSIAINYVSAEELAKAGVEALKAAWLQYPNNDDFCKLLKDLKKYVDRDAWPT